MALWRTNDRILRAFPNFNSGIDGLSARKKNPELLTCSSQHHGSHTAHCYILGQLFTILNRNSFLLVSSLYPIQLKNRQVHVICLWQIRKCDVTKY